MATDVFISNVDGSNNFVFGWANVSVDADGDIPFDWQGDSIPIDVLEKTAYNYVLKNEGVGEMHQGGSVGHLVESIMFTKEKIASLGVPEGIIPEGWWVGFYIPDREVMEKVKSGTYKMFSIQGKAKRREIT